VMAIYDGKVMFAEWFKGYGKSIILSHPGGVYTLYAHNSELTVQRGDSVQKGQMVARAGSTGSLNGPSLYFEVREKDQPVNPLQWLRKMGVR
jgi:murein hydrolase activator